MKKYRFYIVLFILLSVLVSILIFIQMVHIPYNKQKNDLKISQREAMEKNKISSLDCFDQYNGHEVYYIGKDLENVYVFNNNFQLVKKEKIELLNEEAVRVYLINEYGLNEDDIILETGYENKVISYVFKLKQEGNVKYLYFDALSGELIKTYEFES